MITLLRLKHDDPGFRLVYKWPYYVKNGILLIIQAILLLLIYLVYFRVDGGSYDKAIKILHGLNSNTFNYLETNKSDLLIGSQFEMPVFYDPKDREQN